MSRGRHSTARPTPNRPSVASVSTPQSSNELPPYRKLAHPLDFEAQSTIRSLAANSVDKLKAHNKQAMEVVNGSVEVVNDMLRESQERFEKRRKTAGDEQQLAEFQSEVEEKNKELEKSMRGLIDNEMAAQRIDESLESIRNNAFKRLENEYAAQMSQRASQQQSQMQERRRRTNADGDEDEDEDQPSPGPTPADGWQVNLTGIAELYTDQLRRQKDLYTSKSYTARYARNNDYRTFKRILHDAKYGDDGPPLPHEDTWFTEAGEPALGVTKTQRGGDEDEDDIVMDKASISTRCPITYQELREPYTSTKCPHTFEKSAILEYIRSGHHMPDSRKRQRECPIAGCAQFLTADDLKVDPVLVRKIKRMQKAAAAEAEESEEDEEQGNNEDFTQQSIPQVDGGDDFQVPATQQSLATQQPPPSTLQPPATQQPPRSSMIEDLGDPSDDDNDDDDE